MSSKNHLSRYLPAVLLGAAALLALGTYAVLSKSAGTEPSATVVTKPALTCSAKIEELNWESIYNDFSLRVNDKEIYTLSFPEESMVFGGNFYQLDPSSDYAYMEFSYDTSDEYALYLGVNDLIRVDLRNCEVVRLLDSTAGQGGLRIGLDISPDDKYLAGTMEDIGPARFLTISNTEIPGDVTSYPMPDDDYTQFSGYFSPDGSKIALVGAHGKPMSEQGALWIFDMNTRTFGGYQGDSPKMSPAGGSWILNGWVDNETVDVEPNYLN